MKQAYRALVIRVIEIEYDVWAESFDEAVKLMEEDDERREVRQTVHPDEVVDLYEHETSYDC